MLCCMGSGTSYHIINIKKIQEKSLAVKVKGCRDVTFLLRDGEEGERIILGMAVRFFVFFKLA